MDTAHLPLSFSLSSNDTLDTLEAVLAIARRGNVRLGALNVTAHAHGDEVFLELQAGEADLLALFLARLRNLYCVDNIVVHERGSAGPSLREHAPRHAMGSCGCRA